VNKRRADKTDEATLVNLDKNVVDCRVAAVGVGLR
jgi:hypothetical protein